MKLDSILHLSAKISFTLWCLRICMLFEVWREIWIGGLELSSSCWNFDNLRILEKWKYTGERQRAKSVL